MADTLSNYHALGPLFSFGERIWTRLLLSVNFRALFFMVRDVTGQIGDEQGTQVKFLGLFIPDLTSGNFP